MGASGFQRSFAGIWFRLYGPGNVSKSIRDGMDDLDVVAIVVLRIWRQVEKFQ